MEELKFAVIHSLHKGAQTSVATTQMAQVSLSIDLPEVKTLADQLTKLVGKDGSTVLWGQFGTNNREGRFPKAAESLTEDLSLDAFMAMSEIAMSELVTTAREETLATGGHVCFLAYESQGESFLLVAMVKERGALTLSASLVPTEIKEIDLSKLHQAARVNLDRYAAFLRLADPGESDADSVEKTYLCFVNRNQKNDVAQYFVQALGCEKGIASGRITRAVISAVKNFVRANKEIKAHATAARRAVIDHLHALPDGTSVTIETIVKVVQSSLGPDLSHHADDLDVYLNSDQIQIPASFTVSSGVLKTMTRITAASSGWQLSFDDAVLDYADADVIYDREAKSLTFTKLPIDTVKKVEATLSDRRAHLSSNRGD